MRISLYFTKSTILLLTILSCTQPHKPTPNPNHPSTHTTSANNPYPFYNALKGEMLSTDTLRLARLAEYAYPDLRRSHFKKDADVLYVELDIRESVLMNLQFPTEADSLIPDLLTNGKGFFFAKIDSKGVGLPNAFDFGMEVWDYHGGDSREIFDQWRTCYHPMPFMYSVVGDQAYVFYTRSSNNAELLKKHMVTVLITAGTHPSTSPIKR